jgi:hypothetical protein
MAGVGRVGVGQHAAHQQCSCMCHHVCLVHCGTLTGGLVLLAARGQQLGGQRVELPQQQAAARGQQGSRHTHEGRQVHKVVQHTQLQQDQPCITWRESGAACCMVRKAQGASSLP